MAQGIKVKRAFFDRKAVIDAAGNATVQALSKAGAFIWRTAKTSMRRRKRSARGGEPPSAHAGQIKDLLYFSYDNRTSSVVIGPEKFSSRTGGAAAVPRLMEEGGTIARKVGGKSRTLHYAPHPYMAPSLAKEMPQLPARWKGSVRT